MRRLQNPFWMTNSSCRPEGCLCLVPLYILGRLGDRRRSVLAEIHMSKTEFEYPDPSGVSSDSNFASSGGGRNLSITSGDTNKTNGIPRMNLGWQPG